MKPWKTVSLTLLVIVIVATGFGATLIRRGFSARGTPSAAGKLAATTARKLAVPFQYRRLQNPLSASPEGVQGIGDREPRNCTARTLPLPYPSFLLS
jgi:hypothetical protein